MLTVRIISGTYGLSTGDRVIPKDRMSEPFELDDTEAKRLVSLGVAEIITEDIRTGGNCGNDSGVQLDAQQLGAMTNKELKALAEAMGIDTSKMKVKGDFIQAIIDTEVSAPIDDENGENPPEILPEAPVI